ncbi:hypothetical protein ABH927_001352 [Planotetraspora sp. GP83]
MEQRRKGPAVPSGKNLEKALERAAEIFRVGLGSMPLPPEVPHRRMVDLARYGMQATATTLRRHGPSRQLATLLDTIIYLEGRQRPDRQVTRTRDGALLTSAWAASAQADARQARVTAWAGVRRRAERDSSRRIASGQAYHACTCARLDVVAVVVPMMNLCAPDGM